MAGCCSPFFMTATEQGMSVCLNELKNHPVNQSIGWVLYLMAFELQFRTVSPASCACSRQSLISMTSLRGMEASSAMLHRLLPPFSAFW